MTKCHTFSLSNIIEVIVIYYKNMIYWKGVLYCDKYIIYITQRFIELSGGKLSYKTLINCQKCMKYVYMYTQWRRTLSEYLNILHLKFCQFIYKSLKQYIHIKFHKN